MILLLLSGCSPGARDAADSTRKAIIEVAPPFGTSGERQHDFGVVLTKPGLKRTHTYQITNRSTRTARLIQAVNNKVCCGSITFEPCTLATGETATLEVALTIGQATGPITHLATIHTDDDSAPVLEFWTTATPLSRVEIIEVGDADSRLLTGTTGLRHFQVLSRGTVDDPPLELHDTSASGTLPREWETSPKRRILSDGIVEWSRELSLKLEARGDPGPRIDELVIQVESKPLLRHLVMWDVTPAVRAVPSAVVFPPTSHRGERFLLLKAEDSLEFAILSVECDVSGLSVEYDTMLSKTAHRVRIAAGAALDNKRQTGNVRITTNHPKQEVVLLPIYVAEASLQQSEGAVQ
jgi:hypothetical protein